MTEQEISSSPMSEGREALNALINKLEAEMFPHQESEFEQESFTNVGRKRVGKVLRPIVQEVSTLRASLTAAQAEIERLKEWRAKVTVALMRPGGAHYEDVAEHVKSMRAALHELHTMVCGECPSLLNEDSGGDANLALRIEKILGHSDGAQ